mmetsp:Transcript_657/g.1574  ORF Transcript_657/g.1574 Transcript_657/m.1574 type:complete len:234 (-) Transcript_657:933-1634(-)
MTLAVSEVAPVMAVAAAEDAAVAVSAMEEAPPPIAELTAEDAVFADPATEEAPPSIADVTADDAALADSARDDAPPPIALDTAEDAALADLAMEEAPPPIAEVTAEEAALADSEIEWEAVLVDSAKEDRTFPIPWLVLVTKEPNDFWRPCWVSVIAEFAFEAVSDSDFTAPEAVSEMDPPRLLTAVSASVGSAMLDSTRALFAASAMVEAASLALWDKTSGFSWPSSSLCRIC